MSDLAQQRCTNCPQREAAVRCPGCGRYFCWECVSEHRYRYLCASCLEAAAGAGPGGQRRDGVFRALVRTAAAVVLLWVVFYVLGRMLLVLPADYHEGGEVPFEATAAQEDS